MRVFKNKPFARFARWAGLDDDALCQAVRAAGAGAVDADLGGGVLKQRIARPGQGKSGGYRTVVLFKVGSLAFFVYGFAKSDRSNIRADELTAFRKLASALFAYSADELTRAVEAGVFIEVGCDDKGEKHSENGEKAVQK